MLRYVSAPADNLSPLFSNKKFQEASQLLGQFHEILLARYKEALPLKTLKHNINLPELLKRDYAILYEMELALIEMGKSQEDMTEVGEQACNLIIFLKSISNHPQGFFAKICQFEHNDLLKEVNQKTKEEYPELANHFDEAEKLDPLFAFPTDSSWQQSLDKYTQLRNFIINAYTIISANSLALEKQKNKPLFWMTIMSYILTFLVWSGIFFYVAGSYLDSLNNPILTRYKNLLLQNYFPILAVLVPVALGISLFESPGKKVNNINPGLEFIADITAKPLAVHEELTWHFYSKNPNLTTKTLDELAACLYTLAVKYEIDGCDNIIEKYFENRDIQENFDPEQFLNSLESRKIKKDKTTLKSVYDEGGLTHDHLLALVKKTVELKQQSLITLQKN